MTTKEDLIEFRNRLHNGEVISASSLLPTVFVPDYSDLLLQQLAITDNEYAALKSLYGNNGVWDQHRVILVRSLTLWHRATRCPYGDKWTEKLLDAAAHNDERYRAFVDRSASEAALFEKLSDQRRTDYMELNQQNYNPSRS